MPLDSSFRSRLRDALRHSAVRAPGAAAQGAADEEVVATAPEDAPVVRELRYEPDDDRRRADASSQAAWIADMLGGTWQHDEAGVCLVVDRSFSGDLRHGDAAIGEYADELVLYRQSLSRLNLRREPSTLPDLFAELHPSASDRRSNTGSEARLPGVGVDISSGVGLPGFPSTSLTAGGLGANLSRLLFFDLETTGLSGGAGICAFLVGFGWFERDTFRTRQYFLSGYGHEPALLRIASQVVADVTLVSFNGKAFDVPLIDGRYLFHRVPSPFETVEHIDLLHPARRLWRYRPPVRLSIDQERRDAFARYFRMTRSADAESRPRGRERGGYGWSAGAASCALGALEEAVLGFRRTGDVPGGEIPARFFHYVRTGDVRPLQPVLEHNRLDLVSLAALSAIVARMLQEGAGAARNAHECLALGHLFERSGAADRAAACYSRAIDEHAGEDWQTDPIVEREALRRLALRHRHERRFDEAAAAWQRLLDLPSAPSAFDLEAAHALAVHHEHRSRDLEAARTLAVRAMAHARDTRLLEAWRHRLERLERKLGAPRMAG